MSFVLPPRTLPPREEVADLLLKFPEAGKQFLAQFNNTGPVEGCDCCICEAWKEISGAVAE